MDTSSYVVVEKKLNDIIKEFDTSVGTELVEIVRTKLACLLLLNVIIGQTKLKICFWSSCLVIFAKCRVLLINNSIIINSRCLHYLLIILYDKKEKGT